MVNAGIGLFLKKRVERLGGVAMTDSIASSTARSWNKGKRIEWLIQQSKPDVVVIILGANEVFVPFPAATAPEIKAIVRRLDGRACVWVGPPVWKNQTGVVEVQRDNSGPCSYFDTQGLKLSRQPDGIHPDFEGGRAWATAVWNAYFKAKEAPPETPPPPLPPQPNPDAISVR
jgi:lysophospholipase L1-like esterase